MHTFFKGLIFIAGISLISSCEKSNEPDLHDQKIYFEHYAYNFAWGFSQVHWIIDYQGNVRKSKKQDSPLSIRPEKLNEYIELFDTIIYKVDNTELEYYIHLIPRAANGKISQIEQVRRDFGGTVFNCFMPVNGSFKIVTLSEMSDNLDKTNLDPGAMEIDKWLKALHKQRLKK